MVRKLLGVMLFVVVVGAITDTAEARWRLFGRWRGYRTYNYSSNGVTYQAGGVDYSGCTTDQERCQAEANYMASIGRMGHFGVNIGNFEGVGYGSSPYCATCVPRGGMTLTGEATAQGANGMWYTCRSWR